MQILEQVDIPEYDIPDDTSSYFQMVSVDIVTGVPFLCDPAVSPGGNTFPINGLLMGDLPYRRQGQPALIASVTIRGKVTAVQDPDPLKFGVPWCEPMAFWLVMDHQHNNRPTPTNVYDIFWPMPNTHAPMWQQNFFQDKRFTVLKHVVVTLPQPAWDATEIDGTTFHVTQPFSFPFVIDYLEPFITTYNTDPDRSKCICDNALHLYVSAGLGNRMIYRVEYTALIVFDDLSN